MTSFPKETSFVIVHGDCPRGADAFASQIVDEWTTYPLDGWYKVSQDPHPANWEKYGKRAGFVRNAKMVKLGADICLAFIKDDSRGASMTADIAEKAGIDVRRFYE
jgi:hypothetical protein